MAKKKLASEVKEEPLEKQLWKAADKLRKNIDAAEFKHVVTDPKPVLTPSHHLRIRIKTVAVNGGFVQRS